MALFRCAPAKTGYTVIAGPGNAPLRSLEVGRLRLLSADGPYQGMTGDAEVVLHSLVGKSRVAVSGPAGETVFKEVGGRTDLFAELPSCVVVGPGSAYTLTPLSRAADFAVARYPWKEMKPARWVRSSDVDVRMIGEGNHRREVRVVLGDESPGLRIRSGETINPPGQWSSWPRHSFDHRPEIARQFEEVFLYFMKPKEGWGLQRVSGLFATGERVEENWTVHNGDAGVLPLGDHPVVAAPDTTLLYVWFYVSPIPKIYAKWAEELGGYA